MLALAWETDRVVTVFFLLLPFLLVSAVRAFRGKRAPLFRFAGVLALVWMFAPYFLGFTPGQAARWDSPEQIPDVLDEWWMDRTGGGRMTVTLEDGTQVSVYHNRFGQSVNVYRDGEKMEMAEIYNDAGEILASGKAEEVFFHASDGTWDVTVNGEEFQRVPAGKVHFWHAPTAPLFSLS